MADRGKRTKVVILYGGQSVEHEVSCRSASFIFKHLDKQRFEPIGVGIDHQGHWWPQSFSDSYTPPRQLEIVKNYARKPLSEGSRAFGPQEMLWHLCGIDLSIDPSELVFFPMTHGTNGEDGRLQGLFEMAGVTYVGADSLGSAISMNKVFSKQMAAHHGIPVVPYLAFSASQWELGKEQIIRNAISDFGLPLFVKPASLGSSVGISKVCTESELSKACVDALAFDDHILIEQGMEGVREIECAVLGSDQMECAAPGEIIPQGGFYSYDAKYLDHQAAVIQVPAKLTEKEVRTAQEMAIKVASALGIYGMARIDFFLDTKTGQYFFNEANTIPGFTQISQYPLLWQNEGIGGKDLVQQLIDLALKRSIKKHSLQKVYTGQT